MNTVIETNIFSAKASKVWTPNQYEDFVIYIASNPLGGEVVPGSGGVRKVIPAHELKKIKDAING